MYNKITLYAIFLLLITLFSSIFFFVQKDKEEKLISLGDHVIENFRMGRDYETVDLLSFAMALSEDGELKNALLSDDEGQGYQILSNITKRFKKYTHLKSLRLQIITPDFYIFARSWDEGFEGMPLWWFRNDLDALSKNSEPKVGMETGRLLTFKATVPIRSGKKIIGYLEAIKLVDEFVLKLRTKGIELFALMDEKYLEQAELMRDFPLLHNYVIANQNYNHQLIPNIKMIHWDDLMANSYVYKNNMLYLKEPMHNGEGKQIGIYLLAIASDALDAFETKAEKISFFTQFSDDDIEKVVKAWDSPYGSFKTMDDKDLIALLPKLYKEDRAELELKAKSLLRTYSKEELIDMVLSQKHKEKKVGKIE